MEIYIIGGGASGVLCAIELSINKNNRIHILEKNNKLMKKLLLTGNGSCNFTNDDFDFTKNIYNNDFFDIIYKSFDNNSLIEYFNDIGILSTKRDKYNKNYYYPYDYNSKSVYYNLYDKLIENNVDIIYNTEVYNIEKDVTRYVITTNNKKYHADIIIVSTGGKTYKNTGSDGSMYNILKKLDINVVEPVPSLCPLIHKNPAFKDFKGIRAMCKVDAKVDGKILYSEFGEVQFNDNSISGIPILNCSSKVSRYVKNQNIVIITLDFIPNIDNVDYFKNRKKNLQSKLIRDYLCGIVDNKISSFIFDNISINNVDKRYVSTLTENDIICIYNLLKRFDVLIKDTGSFDISQVTKGGIDISEIDKNTLRIKKYNNMYAIGEVVDVDGICGGYNLQFAFSTAIVCARNIDNR